MCSHARNSVSCPEHAPCTCVRRVTVGGGDGGSAEAKDKERTVPGVWLEMIREFLEGSINLEKSSKDMELMEELQSLRIKRMEHDSYFGLRTNLLARECINKVSAFDAIAEFYELVWSLVDYPKFGFVEIPKEDNDDSRI